MDTREKPKNKNPLETANPINKLFFWWTMKLFRKGASNNLDINDIYDPVRADESESLGNKLEREWKIELKKLENIEYGLDGEGKKIKRSQRPSLMRAIVRTFWLKYLRIGMFLLIVAIVLRPLQPVLQGLIVRYFSGGNPSDRSTREETLGYSTGLVLSTLGITFIMHHTNLTSQQIGMRIRVACCSLIYRKSLRLSKSSLGRTAAGQVVNLLSNDVNRFDTLPLFLNYIWIMPFQLVVVGFIMWQSVYACALVGIACLILLAVPIQGYLSKVSSKLRAQTAKLTDRRVQMMNELIAGIQVIKMYAWEKPFEKIVSKTRANEVRVIAKASHLRGFYLSIMVFTERTTLFLTIITYVLMGNALTAQISAELSTHFNILQMTTAIFFPQALIMCGETFVSIKRLEDFLLLDEIASGDDEPKTIIESSQHEFRDEISKKALTVELQRVSANWISGVLPPTLCDVTLKVPSGKLCAMIGPVGSGKSSILNVLLRELPLGAGSVSLFHFDGESPQTQSKRGFVMDNPNIGISYASQDAWLFAGTVRENILFGQPYEKPRYTEVTKVCALLKDFRQLPDGDMTIVSERGSGLSGGQRARINLARAIYRRADLYLLDDPLSAVDAHVARHLFRNCILEYLQGKTRILVTHQLQFLKQADTIVMMDRGTAKHQGSWDELTKSSADFKEMLQRIEEEKVSSENREIEENCVQDNIVPMENQSKTNEGSEISVIPPLDKWMSFRGSREITENITLDNSTTTRTVEDRKFVPPTAAQLPPLTLEILRRTSVKSQDSYGFDDDYSGPPNENASEEEGKTKGRLSSRIYRLYYGAGGGIFILTLLVINLITSQMFTSATDYWISYWANVELVRSSLYDLNIPIQTKEYHIIVNNTLFSHFSLLDEDGLLPKNTAIYIYTFFTIACIVLTLTRSFLFMKISMKASRVLHNTMFANILQATMRFFNVNSSGRILNRFSKDVGAMDELLPKAILETLQIFLILIGILAMIAIVNQWMIIPMIVIAITFYLVRIYYLNTAQDIKRLEGIAKSPVFSHISATLNGLTTIRSSGKDIQITLRKEFDRYQDTHTGAWFMYLATASSFGLVLDLISCIFIAFVCFSFVLIDSDETFGGYVGLAISQSLILTGMLQYGVKLTADVQSQMTAVERVIEYTDLPKEGPLTSRDPPPPSWPHSGRIQLRNVFMRYKTEDPPVLKDLNVMIEPGWKVGVVGRTGAGKSSLISALFRLTGDGLEGEIEIDGRDTGSMGLHELRSCISIIPQEPVLFSESLRYNLDPFGKYDDSTLWDVLREVELTDAVLDQRVTEGGSNFSVGQRQLICLARAILRNNRILVLDEATANIDSRTDALIQRTIRSKFNECTVVTIAHRLNTIIDSDRVLVMDDGRMVQYGSPYELLHLNPDGPFAQMVRQTGEVMAQSLMNFALGAHRRINSGREVSAL